MVIKPAKAKNYLTDAILFSFQSIRMDVLCGSRVFSGLPVEELFDQLGFHEWMSGKRSNSKARSEALPFLTASANAVSLCAF